jgi:hypothetical protein
MHELANADAPAVLTKALFNAADALDLKRGELAAIVGLDRTTLNRYRSRSGIDPQTKTGELALLLIRVYRDLYALFGGNAAQMRHWLTTENMHLNGVPRSLLASVQGLVSVAGYLDAMRGKV